jgi:signal transduction histidine kinase
MKQKLIGLSQRYVTALQNHLRQGPRASLHPALRLGRQAVALGLETLDLARIHEQALITLELSSGKNGKIKRVKRAEIFFTEAMSPIVETHRAARQSKIDLGRLNATLNRRTLELATVNRQLQRGIVRHKVMENAFEKSGKHHNKCLQESLQLQKRLRQLTHQVLAAQENERKKISHELQDEIAQTLLGINVRLLSLKQKARGNTKGLKNEIDKTQRLVLQSAKSVRLFAHELDIQHE